MDQPVLRARQATEQHRWREAVEAFARAEESEDLSPDDLRRLAEAAWWSGEYDRAVDALERAVAAYVEESESVQAAETALILAYISFRSQNFTVAGGWMAQAEDLLSDQPESASHAWLRLLQGAAEVMGAGDIDVGIARIEEALDLAERHQNRPAHCLGQSIKGANLVEVGDWREGLGLIDRAVTEAMSGPPGDLRTAADVYCITIAACRDVGDYRRASEWTDRAERWMQRQSVSGYPGICRVHRAELKRLHGEWGEAAEEAEAARIELERFHLLDAVGFAHYELGELRRRSGDLAEAEESFMRAFEYGWDPQPGLALTLLAKGEAEEAERSIVRSLGDDTAGTSRPLPVLAGLLPARVTIALARGDVESARIAAARLGEIANIYQSTAVVAASAAAGGAVALAEGRHREAVDLLESAWRGWNEIGLPYEAAETRVMLGRAHRAAGDDGAARMVWRAALATFQRLGAEQAAAEVSGLLPDTEPKSAAEKRVTATFMFTDIVTSTEMVEVLGDSVWANLINWHDRVLRQIFTDHGGEEIKHTGDGFFVSFDDPDRAVAAATEIQRRLQSHRVEHGFAPGVRIGVHSTEAIRQGDDYRGQGVHLAARVGGMAERDEILVTDSVVQAAGLSLTADSARTVDLKGISGPVRIYPVEWR